MNQNIDNSIQADRSWEKIVMKYNRPELRKSIWQMLNTLVPYAVIWFLLVQSLQYPYWVTLLLTLPASGLLIRAFIIFHDCGHGSYFQSKSANNIVGKFLGILTFTPFSSWNNTHRIHHATSGNLDQRGVGDVWTLTLEEYIARSPRDRFLYRMYRHPFVMFILGPIYMVIFRNRLTTKKMSSQERVNVYITNFGILVTATVLSLIIGVKAYLLIQLPIVLIAHTLGIWLFYVQHQYDDVFWERSQQWDYKSAAIEGSSFLKLPLILQWFTGSIGFHHVHHLSSKIPNYNLARCHYENEIFRQVKPITILSSFKTLNLRLWDETSRQMISFRKMAVLMK